MCGELDNLTVVKLSFACYLIIFICFFRGRINYFTYPPETHLLPTHVSAQILTEMSKEFDWDELEKGNQETLAGIESLSCKKQQFIFYSTSAILGLVVI